MRDFNNWFSTFRNKLATYEYYVNFDKIYNQAEIYKVELNILNSLISSDNIEEEFISIVDKYPEVLKCVPILLAVRSTEIFAMDSEGEFKYSFTKPNQTVEQYKEFMIKTGLFDLMQNKIVSNLYDYVLGVETGLDSNARKNRGGAIMEDLVEEYIVEAGFIKNKDYFKEMYGREIEKKWSIDLSSILNKGKSSKRFDFVIKSKNNIYAIETNFYNSIGSKLNETSRSYKYIADASKNIENFKFIWFTDGGGWSGAKKNLRETFEVMEHLYNIHDLENGIISKVVR